MSPNKDTPPLLRAVGVAVAALGVAGVGWTVWNGLEVPGLVWTAVFPAMLLSFAVVVVVGATADTRWRTFTLWAGLSLVGYAHMLQLVSAGRAVLYQHLSPAVAPMTDADWVLMAGLLAYCGVVLIGLWARAGVFGDWIRENVGTWRAVAVLGAWAALSASPLRDLRGYALEVTLSTSLGLAALGATVLAVVNLPEDPERRLGERVGRLFKIADGKRRLDPVALAAAATSTIVAAALALWVWERHPHISDEISFLFQAKYFAAGSLTAPGVPVPALFEAYQIDCSVDRCLSVLQPGWPALLSMGVKAGVPWLINPLIAGLNVLLLFVFVRELYGTALARGASWLLAVSPWFLFLGMSFMNHQATLLGGLVAVTGTTLAIRRGQLGWVLLAGAGAGFTSLMRPMDGLIVAFVAGVPLLLHGSPGRRASAALLFGAGTAALGSFNLLYNHALTGHFLEFPVTTYVNELWGEGTNNLGFGPDRGIYPEWAHMDGFPGHSPFQAVVNAILNLTALQFDLFGWGMGSFLPILLLLVWGRLARADWLMIGWILVINALYSLYWFASGPDFAARYWFLAVVPLVVLSARGLARVWERIDSPTGPRGRGAAAVAVLLLATNTLLVFVPWRSTDKYHRYFDTGPVIREALDQGRLPDGVYLIRGSNQPDYAAAMIYTAPALASGDVIFAYDGVPDAASQLHEAFPDKHLWILDASAASESGYRILAEPRTTLPGREE